MFDSTILIQLTADIVGAYVANNSVPVSQLPEFISSVHAALTTLGEPVEATKEPQSPAVPIKKSVTPEYIISLEDGKKFQSLKRHLSTAYGMTPAEYRAKWGLPSDYPMVAPGYAAKRSELAKTMGLGRKGKSLEATESNKPAPRGRPKKLAA